MFEKHLNHTSENITIRFKGLHIIVNLFCQLREIFVMFISEEEIDSKNVRGEQQEIAKDEFTADVVTALYCHSWMSVSIDCYVLILTKCELWQNRCDAWHTHNNMQQ